MYICRNIVRMKKITSILAAMLMTLGLLAQDAVLTWGAPFKGALLRNNLGVLSADERGINVLAPAPGLFDVNLNVLSFDNSMNFITSKLVLLRHEDRKLTFEFVVNMKGHTLVFSSYVDLKESKKVLIYKEFDRENLNLSSEAVRILDMPVVSKPMPQVGQFSYALSPDSTKVALVYNPPSAKGGMERFGCAVLNEELKIISNRMDVFPFKDRNYELWTSVISDQGVVYLNGLLTEGVRNPFKNEPNYSFSVLRMAPDNTPPMEIGLTMDPYFITDLQIGCDHRGDVFAAGFYSEKGTLSIKGTLCVKIDGATGNVVHSSRRDIPMELITAGMTDRQAEHTEAKAERGGNTEMREYRLGNLLVRPDNGLYLIAEQNYSRTYRTYSGNGHYSEHTVYYANNIIVVGMNSSGDIDLTQAVLKKQKSSASANVSYFCLMKGRDLYFLFSDSPINNAPNPPSTVQASFSKTGVTTLARVSADGRVSRRTLFRYDQQPFIFYPVLAEMLPGDELMLVGLKGMKARAGWLKLRP